MISLTFVYIVTSDIYWMRLEANISETKRRYNLEETEKKMKEIRVGKMSILNRIVKATAQVFSKVFSVKLFALCIQQKPTNFNRHRLLKR